MKKILFAILVFVMVGCQEKEGVIEQREIHYDKNKVKIDIEYPFAVGFPTGEQINPTFDTIIRTSLSIGDKVDFKSSYEELFAVLDTTFKSDRVSDVFELDLNYEGYENRSILSIVSTTFVYAGGAHPSTILNANSFCRATGKRIDVLSLIADQEAFRKMLIDAFITARDLPQNPTVEQTGLFAPLEDLPIPSNIIFTDKGLRAIYNQYEIAPYVFGQTILDIPYDRIVFTKEIDVNDFRELKDEVK